MAYFKAEDALEFVSVYIPPFKFNLVTINDKISRTSDTFIEVKELENLLEPSLFKKMRAEVIQYIPAPSSVVSKYRTEKEIENYNEIKEALKESLDI